MLVTTTNAIEGRRIVEYKGLVAGEAILGANIFRDLFASIRDIVGGRSGAYERVLNDARQTAIGELTDKAAALGANAVIGVDLDYETIGSNGSMLMVTAAGKPVGHVWKDKAGWHFEPGDSVSLVATSKPLRSLQDLVPEKLSDYIRSFSCSLRRSDIDAYNSSRVS